MAERLCFLTGKIIKDKKKKKSPEAAVGRAIDDFLRLKGAYLRRVNSSGTMRGGKWTTSQQGAGISDRIGIMPDSRFIAVELKSPGKRRTVTEPQLAFLMNIAKRGGIACVADSISCVEKALTASKEEMLATLQDLVKKHKHSPSSDDSFFD